MITENLSTLKIYKLSQEQYDKRLEDGNIEANALYMTPDAAYENIDEFRRDLDKLESSLENIKDGSVTVANATTATTATKATQDGNGKVISDTYETKTDSQNKLTEAKGYTDTKISDHKNDKNNPHTVTKEQIGLGNVNNTSDMDKPVSTAQQAELNKKADTNHNHNDLYDPINSASNALKSAKEYADKAVANLLENSTEAVDSIYELRDAMNINADAITALQSIAGNKADKEHNHDDKYYTESEIDTKFAGVTEALNGKAPTSHSHDDKYYTEDEIDNKISAINTSISNLSSGTTVVKKAETATTATTATSATSATKATQDASGNVITSTYETKVDASSKLSEAKSYADSAATQVKNDLLNGAGAAYDTLKELGDLINENVNAIDALETVASGKADKDHEHDDYALKSDVNKFGGTVEITADAPTKENTVLAVNPEAEEVNVYTAEEVDYKLTRVLPSVTTSDNGKFLRVVDGVWAKTTVKSGEEMAF